MNAIAVIGFGRRNGINRFRVTLATLEEGHRKRKTFFASTPGEIDALIKALSYCLKTTINRTFDKSTSKEHLKRAEDLFSDQPMLPDP